MKKNATSWPKTIDPKDPTAWFYDAILKQSQNRPVGGIGGLAKIHRAERQPGCLPLTPDAG
jgi:hypothetical protein